MCRLKRLRPGEIRLNLELAEFVQSALSHHFEPILLRDWQASMQRRCLLHRFPCRLWYEFIYDWHVEAQPSITYTYPEPDTPDMFTSRLYSPAQQMQCEIRISTTPVISMTAQTNQSTPETGQLSIRIHRL